MVEIGQSVGIWARSVRAADSAASRTIVPTLRMWDELDAAGGRNRDKSGNVTRTWTRATLEAASAATTTRTDKTGISVGTVETYLKQANRLKLDLSDGWHVGPWSDEDKDDNPDTLWVLSERDSEGRQTWTKWTKGGLRVLVAHLAAILDKPANNGQTPDPVPTAPESDKSDTPATPTTPTTESDKSDEAPIVDAGSDAPASAVKADKTGTEAVLAAIETIRTNLPNLDAAGRTVAISAIADVLDKYGISLTEGRLSL